MMNVAAESKIHRPVLTEYRHGIKASLSSCLCLTLIERLQVVDLSSLNKEHPLSVKFKFTWGLDGSGSHSNFNHISKAHFSTESVMSVCFSLTEVTIKDQMGTIFDWTCK